MHNAKSVYLLIFPLSLHLRIRLVREPPLGFKYPKNSLKGFFGKSLMSYEEVSYVVDVNRVWFWGRAFLYGISEFFSDCRFFK